LKFRNFTAGIFVVFLLQNDDKLLLVLHRVEDVAVVDDREHEEPEGGRQLVLKLTVYNVLGPVL
jgi:hypothetical protein